MGEWIGLFGELFVVVLWYAATMGDRGHRRDSQFRLAVMLEAETDRALGRTEAADDPGDAQPE